MTFAKKIAQLMAGTAIVALTSFSAMAAVAPQIGGMVGITGTAANDSAGSLVQLAQSRRGAGRGARRGRGFGRSRGRGAGARSRRGRSGIVRQRGRRGRGIGPVIGAGIAAAIIGGAISTSKRTYSGRWQRCDDRFKSFRWSDGTYQPYGGGSRRLCPYLRN